MASPGFGSRRGTKRHRNNLSHMHNNNMKLVTLITPRSSLLRTVVICVRITVHNCHAKHSTKPRRRNPERAPGQHVAFTSYRNKHTACRQAPTAGPSPDTPPIPFAIPTPHTVPSVFPLSFQTVIIPQVLPVGGSGSS